MREEKGLEGRANCRDLFEHLCRDCMDCLKCKKEKAVMKGHQKQYCGECFRYKLECETRKYLKQIDTAAGKREEAFLVLCDRFSSFRVFYDLIKRKRINVKEEKIHFVCAEVDTVDGRYSAVLGDGAKTIKMKHGEKGRRRKATQRELFEYCEENKIKRVVVLDTGDMLAAKAISCVVGGRIEDIPRETALVYKSTDCLVEIARPFRCFLWEEIVFYAAVFCNEEREEVQHESLVERAIWDFIVEKQSKKDCTVNTILKTTEKLRLDYF
ncbi:MAG: uncharacterized protein A8A55_2564 [Amphiamblys sp. WSBS2006]|nr:MAG: uncharacterized protein A8A55_2564 [Amphiamblys sp. WSBS2006]